jgi:hypothetical protein
MLLCLLSEEEKRQGLREEHREERESRRGAHASRVGWRRDWIFVQLINY